MSNTDLIAFIEGKRMEIADQERMAHDKLHACRAKIQAAGNELKRHIDQVSADIEAMKADVTRYAIQKLGGGHEAEVEYENPRFLQNVNETFNDLYQQQPQNGISH